MARGNKANREAAAALGVATETLVRKRAPRKATKVAAPVPALDGNATMTTSAERAARRGAPSRYTVQMSLILDAVAGGKLRADIAAQQKLDPTRTQAVVLREIFDRGVAELQVDWQARGFIASDKARKAAIAAAAAPRLRGGTLRATRERVNGKGANGEA
jgi:hypothetical protein